jgi:hypothetical protein
MAKRVSWFWKGWLFLAKNIPSLIISGYVCHKYPLQRDIFCINEASLLCVPFGPLWSFAPYEASLLGGKKVGLWFLFEVGLVALI